MIPIRTFDYNPLLGWSSSRLDVFEICKRRYYYQYYSKYDHEVPANRIALFRSLVSMPMETGGIVHEVIKVLLNRLILSSTALDTDKFYDFAKRTAKHAIATKTFEEVAYGERPAIHLDDLFPKIRECLENLLGSNRLLWLQRDALPSKNDWIVDPPGFGETRIADLKAFCKVDFLFPTSDHFHIIDWKTGKPQATKHRRQLVGYASWASFHLETEPERVRPTIAYMHPNYSEIEETFNSYDLDSFAIQVREQTEEMYKYCQDVQENIPHPKQRFPMIDDSRICAFCSFRGICYAGEYPTAL